MTQRTKRGSRTGRRRPARWWALALGLAAGAAAFYLLVRGDPDRPLGRVDAESRAQLERILEQADHEARP